MSNKYKRTSTEELTVMADLIREVGTFTEGQTFVFPSSEYDQNPTITYYKYESNSWIEITEEQAAQLPNTEYVAELPVTGVADTAYVLTEFHMGFAEAYEQALNEFQDKVTFGELTQEDIDGVILSKPTTFFGYLGTTGTGNSFPSITEITVEANLLKQNRFFRLRGLEKVNIIDKNNANEIGHACFINCHNLQEIDCKPTTLESYSFGYCENLKFGEGFLDLSECINFEENCLRETSITEITFYNNPDPNATPITIGSKAFEKCSDLKNVYLPDIPPNLDNIDAFSDTHNDLVFWVSNADLISDDPSVAVSYKKATNWKESALISRFEVIPS